MRTKSAANKLLFPGFLIDHLFSCRAKDPDLLIITAFSGAGANSRGIAGSE